MPNVRAIVLVMAGLCCALSHPYEVIAAEERHAPPASDVFFSQDLGSIEETGQGNSPAYSTASTRILGTLTSLVEAVCSGSRGLNRLRLAALLSNRP